MFVYRNRLKTGKFLSEKYSDLFLSKISAIFSPFGSVCQCRDTEGLFLLCSCKINLSEVCENCEKELFCRNKKTFYQKMLSKKTEYRTIDTAKL